MLAGKAGMLLSRRRLVLVSRASGVCLIGGGAWLALTRAPVTAIGGLHLGQWTWLRAICMS
jgi:hypothetical protein